MKLLTTATRLSLSLSALSISVLLAAQSVGLMPDPATAALKGRKDLCESLAITYSNAAQCGDVDSIGNSAAIVMERNHDVLSLAMRQANGTLLVQAGNHERLWRDAQARSGGHSDSTHVEVPIYRNDVPWATLEVCFTPISARGPWAFLHHPITRLVLFMFGAGFFAYLFYLRRTLKYLDPSAVIPERVKAMLDTLAEGVLILDCRERIILANDAFAELAGHSSSMLVGTGAAELPWAKAGSDEAPESFPWTDCLADSTTHKGTPLNLKRGDARRALTVNCAPIHGVNGSVRGVLLTFDDVTLIEETNTQLRKTLTQLEKSREEIERQNAELHTLATIDPLTGCRNRRSFYPELQSQWSAARRYGQAVAVIMLDVDHFKKINDKHGHAVGDQVLQGVSKILRMMARDTDLVCRYGGEEFCVLLPHADVTAAARAAERYRAAIESERCGAVTVTASFGVSALHLGASDPQEILDQADKALYAAKRSGRNRVVRWDEIPPELAAEAPKPTDPVREDQKFSGPIAFHAVTALMSALSHRDKATAEHSQRVADLCVQAARGLMSVRDCFILEIAALMHDIGKLGVPDSILRKPGALNEDEWKVMRTHERMGVEILSAAFGSAALTEIVSNHHVWYVGSSVCVPAPSGADIPVGARLLSIADAFDAITSNRPYRKGRSREQGFEELRRAAGSQFDPGLVEKFIATIGATDEGQRPAPVLMHEDKAIRIRLDLAKLAVAADCHDLTAVADAARELAAATAGDRDGVSDRIALLQKALGNPTVPEPDLLKILALTHELQELCRAVTNSEPAREACAGAAEQAG